MAGDADIRSAAQAPRTVRASAWPGSGRPVLSGSSDSAMRSYRVLAGIPSTEQQVRLTQGKSMRAALSFLLCLIWAACAPRQDTPIPAPFKVPIGALSASIPIDSIAGCYAGVGLQQRYGAEGEDAVLFLDSLPPGFVTLPQYNALADSLTGAWLLRYGGPEWPMWGEWRQSNDTIAAKFYTYPETFYTFRLRGDSLIGNWSQGSDLVLPRRFRIRLRRAPAPPLDAVRLGRVPCPQPLPDRPPRPKHAEPR
jgi:hypothetical protein